MTTAGAAGLDDGEAGYALTAKRPLPELKIAHDCLTAIEPREQPGNPAMKEARRFKTNQNIQQTTGKAQGHQRLEGQARNMRTMGQARRETSAIVR
jgi:hypothetical protein